MSHSIDEIHLVRCGVCHVDSVKMVLAIGEHQFWEMYLCLDCLKNWKNDIRKSSGGVK